MKIMEVRTIVNCAKTRSGKMKYVAGRNMPMAVKAVYSGSYTVHRK